MIKACLKRINHKTNCLILRTTTRFESECTGYFTGKCRVNFPLLRDMEKKVKEMKQNKTMVSRLAANTRWYPLPNDHITRLT
ncbi:hypothetical protein BLOT_000584 [Blomia tropicalis]|nr:hypothetical protein BLOT_000584 [Blomia tropicalis]